MTDGRAELNNTELCLSCSDGGKKNIKILDALGKGGSCIAYRAIVAERGFLRKLVIKEFFPKSLFETGKLVRRENGNLKRTNPSTDNFDILKENFVRGAAESARFYEEDPDKALSPYVFIGEGNGTVYIAVDMGDGCDLEKVDMTGFVFNRVIEVMESLCSAVGRIHEKKYLYLDIKPENIYLSTIDNHDHVKLFDFDTLVSIKDVQSGRNGVCSCSMGWSAPEQKLEEGINGEKRYSNALAIDRWTDIYSIGAVFFWFLTGRNLLEGDLEKIRKGAFEWADRSDFCKGLSRDTLAQVNSIIEDTLEENWKERRSRFTSVWELQRRFKVLKQGLIEDSTITDIKKALLDTIFEVQNFAADTSGKGELKKGAGPPVSENVQEILSQEIEKKERLKALFTARLAEYEELPSEFLKKELNSAEKALKEQEERIETIRQNLIEGLKLAARHINEEKIDDREKAALQSISTGDYEAANRILRSSRWRQDTIDLETLYAQIQEKSRQYISGQQILLSNLVSFGVNNESDREIRDIYKTITDLSEKYGVSYETFYEYADYLYAQSDCAASLDIIDRLEKIYALHPVNNQNIIKLKVLKGNVYYEVHNYKKALKQYQDALDYYLEEDQKELSETKKNEILGLSLNIANTFWKMNQYAKGERVLKDIIPYAEEISARSEFVYSKEKRAILMNAANVYNRLATMNTAKWDWHTAEKYHLEALRIKEMLVNADPENEEYLLDMSKSCNNVAVCYKNLDMFEKAEAYYLKSFSIRRSGVERNYLRYALSLALVCSNYARMLGMLKRTEEAKQMMIQYVLPIKQQYYHRYPEDYGESLAYSYEDYGYILMKSGDPANYSEAEDYYLKAIQIKDTLLKKDRLSGTSTVAHTYTEYAELLEIQNKEYKGYYEKALEIYRSLEDQNPGFYTKKMERIKDAMQE